MFKLWSIALVGIVMLFLPLYSWSEVVKDELVVGTLTHDHKDAGGCSLFLRKTNWLRPIFQWDSQAWMHINGKDIQLTPIVGEYEYGKKDLRVHEFTADDIRVVVDYGSYKVQNNVLMLFKKAKITLYRNKTRKVIKAEGGCVD